MELYTDKIQEANYSMHDVELYLVTPDGLENKYEFEGKLLGQGARIDDNDATLITEIARIYQKKDGKFVGYVLNASKGMGIIQASCTTTEELKPELLQEGLINDRIGLGAPDDPDTIKINNLPAGPFYRAYQTATQVYGRPD